MKKLLSILIILFATSVYMMTYMVTKDRTESISVLTIPNGTESCILYHTFDLIEDLENYKKTKEN